MSMGWTWPWTAAANTYRANRYIKAREDTQRRYQEAGMWGTGVFSDIHGMWLNFTLWPTTVLSGLTGIHWKPEAEERAEIPKDIEERELGKGYKAREELDREIADFEAERITSYLTLHWTRAGRASEAIRHAKERAAIHLPGKVTGDEDSPLTNSVLIAGGVATAGAIAAGTYYYLGGSLSPSSTPENTLHTDNVGLPAAPR